MPGPGNMWAPPPHPFCISAPCHTGMLWDFQLRIGCHQVTSTAGMSITPGQTSTHPPTFSLYFPTPCPPNLTLHPALKPGHIRGEVDSGILAAGMFLLFLVSPCPTCTMVPWTDAAQENGMPLCSAFLRFFFPTFKRLRCISSTFLTCPYMPESTSPLMCPGLKSIFDFRQKKKALLKC
ncbi:hypothetical protein Pelo_19288 [Pelomyxa schiedti]|nr:hypothetical protein Pelo_19288 [Pelomyxa schiedti]